MTKQEAIDRAAKALALSPQDLVEKPEDLCGDCPSCRMRTKIRELSESDPDRLASIVQTVEAKYAALEERRQGMVNLAMKAQDLAFESLLAAPDEERQEQLNKMVVQVQELDQQIGEAFFAQDEATLKILEQPYMN